MTKLIFHQLWSDFKKHWLGILITLVLCYFSTLFVFSFGFSLYLIDSESYLLSEAELMEHVLHSDRKQCHSLFYHTGRFFIFCYFSFPQVSCPAFETDLFLPGRYRIETQISTLLFLDQSFFLSDFF